MNTLDKIRPPSMLTTSGTITINESLVKVPLCRGGSLDFSD